MSSGNAPRSISGVNIHSQLEELKRKHRGIYECVDSDLVEGFIGQSSEENRSRDDFGAEKEGGRGGSYIQAQSRNVQARVDGIERMLNLMRRDGGGLRRVVDLLGGDGLVRRVCSLLGFSDLEIITCDASPLMVEAAWASGIPALLQRAERMLFRSESVDAVLLAYGTHHIDPGARLGVVEEAYRVLRSGGTFVLHDFLVGSPVDRWFSEIVDRYSLTGHKYAHFTRDEIREYLIKAGFGSVEVLEIDDPYMATGKDPKEAELRVGEYLVDMYGLRKAQENLGDAAAFRWAATQAKEMFRYPAEDGAMLESVTEYVEQMNAWRCTIPRRAIIGVAEKI